MLREVSEASEAAHRGNCVGRDVYASVVEMNAALDSKRTSNRAKEVREVGAEAVHRPLKPIPAERICNASALLSEFAVFPGAA